MEEKKLHISVSTILLIIAIGVIIVMSFMLYEVSSSKSKAETEIQQLKAETQDMQTTLDNIQNSLSKVTSTKNNETGGHEVATKSDNNIASNTSKTEEEQVKEVANAFVKAVNEQDWATVEKYSSKQIVSDLKKYNVSNMSIDLNTLEKNPNKPNGYYCYDSYDIDYNGLNIKDLSLGRLFCIDNKNGTFVVSTCYATGL